MTRGAGSGGADKAALERVFRGFLAASGAPKGTPELEGTARRAADAWADEFLDGYRTTPAKAIGKPSPAGRAGIVVVTGMDYVSVCPHHLLPYRGVAHVAYEPSGQVAGFGRLAALVDALGHRLVLQETLAGQVAEALVEHLGAKGAAVVLDAEQTCFSMRGERRPRARAIAESQAGASGKAVLARIHATLRKQRR